jgi:hypothetical protein
MSDASVSDRRRHFSAHWMTWLVVHHFLPASLLRELISVVVGSVSEGTIELGQLIQDIQSSEEKGWNDSWMIRTLEVEFGQRTTLQRLIRGLVWQNDMSIWSGPDIQDPRSANSKLLSMITRFGSFDFGISDRLIDEILASTSEIQPSLVAFLEVFKTVKSTHRTHGLDAIWDVAERVKSLEMPLAALVTKHLADLCADADEWSNALDGYVRTKQLLDNWEATPAWNKYIGVWNSIIEQSRAGAIRLLIGPKAAVDVLSTIVRQASLTERPLAAANVELDLLVMSSHPDVEGMNAVDHRVAILHAPLMHYTHNDSEALHNTTNERYEDAHRHFWATLRRQVALGAYAEANGTKARYAGSILKELRGIIAKDKRIEQFHLAIRLLIESLSPDAVSRVEWSDALVDAYVDQTCVDLVILRAKSYVGCRRERELVAIELFRKWTERMAPSKRKITVLMWRHLATLAANFPSRFESSVDVGRQSLEVLKDLAQKMPELRQDVAPAVAGAICERIKSDDLIWGNAAALEAAAEYVDIFDDELVQRIIEGILAILKNIDPARDIWPLVRPALEFLVTPSVKRCAGNSSVLGQRIIDQIIRFGMEQESEHARLFFYLHDFAPSLLRDPNVVKQMQRPIEEVRRWAGEARSTRVTDSINALLLVPAISGFDGIKDALDGLDRVIESSRLDARSPGLPYAYDSILLLTDNAVEILSEFPSEEKWLRAKFERLVVLVIELWEAANSRPLLFAPFAFPPLTRPNSVIVHNWALASLRFAEMSGAIDRIEGALSKASAQPDLAESIALARATRSTAESGDDEVGAIRMDDREAFYLALGRRLVRLEMKIDGEARRFCEALVEQCLRFGPRELDAPVLLSAFRIGLHEHVRASGLDQYVTRLQRHREYRLTLRPITELFRKGGVPSS